jgi:hypothetical protein
MSLHNKNVSAYQQVVKINSECLSHLLACFAFRTLGVCHCITNWLTEHGAASQTENGYRLTAVTTQIGQLED